MTGALKVSETNSVVWPACCRPMVDRARPVCCMVQANGGAGFLRFARAHGIGDAAVRSPPRLPALPCLALPCRRREKFSAGQGRGLLCSRIAGLDCRF